MSEQVPPGYYCTRDVARVLGVQPDAVRQLVHRGRLKRSGSTPRQPWYRVADVAALVAGRVPSKAA
ncbi:hypothetical protein [Streptomyces djakartensis]|uniref:Helix-turn-helix domain-containing protein n=1 Tax=Streptomyces djakartensis TaxID=68193 RepID=A0ABQ2ZH47_9ACTN|nr:hypothetical protein [Streptomyces djakartensis]GGY13089.1 hypothetical protein GCM10010384_18410 [Streptomyces djakartensis]